MTALVHAFHVYGGVVEIERGSFIYCPACWRLLSAAEWFDACEPRTP